MFADDGTCSGCLHIRSKIGVVPVRMREIQIDLDIPFVGCVTDFLHDIPPEWRLHDRVREVAWLPSLGPPGAVQLVRLLTLRFGVEQGEAFVMLGGQGEHLHSAFLESVHPPVWHRSP